MSQYFTRLAQRSGLQTATARPNRVASVAPTSPAPTASAPLEQDVEIEALSSPADLRREEPASSRRRDVRVGDRRGVTEASEQIAWLRSSERAGGPFVEDRSDQAWRRLYTVDVPAPLSGSEGAAATARSLPMAERAVGPSVARQEDAALRTQGGESTSASRASERASAPVDEMREAQRVARRGDRIHQGEPDSRAAAGGSRHSAAPVADPLRAVALAPAPAIDLVAPRQSVARSDPAVEVRIGTMTIEVSTPKAPPSPRPPATPTHGDRFSPHRHYLRAW